MNVSKKCSANAEMDDEMNTRDVNAGASSACMKDKVYELGTIQCVKDV